MSPFHAVALALVVAQAPAETPTGEVQRPPPPAAQAPPAAEARPGAEVLTLDDALRLAGERNLDLKAARARLRQADELSRKAWSGYLPQLTVSGAYTRNQYESVLPFPVYSQVRTRTGAPGTEETPNPDNPSDPAGLDLPGDPSPYFLATVTEDVTLQELNQLSAQAELNQAIFAPQLWFLIPNARRGEKVAELNVEGARRDVLFGVAQAYYGVASLRQGLEVSERLLEIAQRQEKDARVRYQAGTIAKVGLLRAEIDRARAEQDVRRAMNSYQSGRIALATLLDREPDFEVVDPPMPELPPDLAALEQTALRDRTEVQASRLQVDIERASRSAARARYLPNVGAFGRYSIANTGGFTGESDQWAVGLGLQWQVLDGGLRESDVRESGARIAEAEATAASTAARVRQEVRQAILDLESARANAVKAREQRDLAAENLRLVDVSFRAGAATAVELADATAALRNAEIGFTAESLGAQVAALRVLRAAGEFEPLRRR
jgi:outer membrane protein TolC